MAYATKQNLIDRYGLDELVTLTDRATPPAGAVDDTVIAAALSDADSEINSILAGTIQTPIAPVPGILVPRACAIARYYLFAARATEKVKTDYNDAIAWLGDIRDGKQSLGDAILPTTPTTSGKPQFVNGSGRRFTSKSMRDF